MNNKNRHYSIHYSIIDKLCISFDQTLRTLGGQVKTTHAAYPAENIVKNVLTPDQAKHAAALMRVNHTGEVCAQALYHGQAVVSRRKEVYEKLQQASIEEGDHLTWCKRRLDELNDHPSYLNLLWYTGSFYIGLLAGLIGDKWSLGFIAETEKQVVLHLKKHLYLLPKEDQRSFHILKKMEEDETRHRDEAIALGAKPLPFLIQKIMQFTSKIMVKISYWI
jgi:ubiquinone biosynthesis monooxygenase Coq7